MPDRFRENIKRENGEEGDRILREGFANTNNTPLGSQLHYKLRHKPYAHHKPLIPSSSVIACSKGAGVSFLVNTSPVCRSEAWYSRTKLESSPKNCS